MHWLASRYTGPETTALVAHEVAIFLCIDNWNDNADARLIGTSPSRMGNAFSSLYDVDSSCRNFGCKYLHPNCLLELLVQQSCVLGENYNVYGFGVAITNETPHPFRVKT